MTREADEIEVLAEEAIVASGAALEQYLIDFPEDDKIDTIIMIFITIPAIRSLIFL